MSVCLYVCYTSTLYRALLRISACVERVLFVVPHMHTCMHACMHACIHTYIHTCMHTYRVFHICTNMFIYIYTYIHIYIYLHIDIFSILEFPPTFNCGTETLAPWESRPLKKINIWNFVFWRPLKKISVKSTNSENTFLWNFVFWMTLKNISVKKKNSEKNFL